MGVTREVAPIWKNDARDLRDYAGPCEHSTGTDPTETISNWNDCVSSIRVAAGWRAAMFCDGGIRGESLESSAAAPNLQRVPGSCSHGG